VIQTKTFDICQWIKRRRKEEYLHRGYAIVVGPHWWLFRSERWVRPRDTFLHVFFKPTVKVKLRLVQQQL